LLAYNGKNKREGTVSGIGILIIQKYKSNVMKIEYINPGNI